MAYGTPSFNAAFTRAPIIPILSRINPIPRIDTYLFKVHSKRGNRRKISQKWNQRLETYHCLLLIAIYKRCSWEHDQVAVCCCVTSIWEYCQLNKEKKIIPDLRHDIHASLIFLSLQSKFLAADSQAVGHRPLLHTYKLVTVSNHGTVFAMWKLWYQGGGCKND